MIDFIPSLESHEFIWDDEDEIDHKLRKKLRAAFRTVDFIRKEYNVDRRTAAYITALKRLNDVYEFRGIWP